MFLLLIDMKSETTVFKNQKIIFYAYIFIYAHISLFSMHIFPTFTTVLPPVSTQNCHDHHSHYLPPPLPPPLSPSPGAIDRGDSGPTNL